MSSNRSRDKYIVYRKLIFYLLIFFCAIGLFQFIRAGRWDGKRRFTVVINSSPLILFSIEPQSRRAIVVSFPVNTLLDVPYGYNTYPASSVYRLGELDSKRGGGKLLSKSIENTFGIAVDGYIAMRNSQVQYSITPLEVGTLKKQYFSFTSLIRSMFRIPGELHGVATDLPVMDFVKLWNAIRIIRNDRINIMQLEGSKALLPDKLADGTAVLQIDTDILDFLLADNFQDQDVRAQNITLEVVNATDREKVALQFSRILEHLGAHVIAKSTSDHAETVGCLMTVSKEDVKHSIIVERLMTLYRCQVKNAVVESNLADIKIILGKEFTQ